MRGLAASDQTRKSFEFITKEHPDLRQHLLRNFASGSLSKRFVFNDAWAFNSSETADICYTICRTTRPPLRCGHSFATWFVSPQVQHLHQKCTSYDNQPASLKYIGKPVSLLQKPIKACSVDLKGCTLPSLKNLSPYLKSKLLELRPRPNMRNSNHFSCA